MSDAKPKKATTKATAGSKASAAGPKAKKETTKPVKKAPATGKEPVKSAVKKSAGTKAAAAKKTGSKQDPNATPEFDLTSAPSVETKSAKRSSPAKPTAESATKESASSGSQKASKPISNNDIALRAYFISQERAGRGHASSPHDDWVEAERQLRQERRMDH